MELDCLSPARAVVAAIQACLNRGEAVSPRGMRCYEQLNVTLTIHEPWRIPFQLENRAISAKIGALEALQLVGQTSRPELMPKAFEQFKNGGLLHGAYGLRVYGNLEHVSNLLKKDHDSRQAVLSIFDSGRDLRSHVKDVPCTLSIQFFRRDGRLHMRVSMRSNDVWLGLPYDLLQFTALQGAMAESLDLPMGEYTHTVGSMHLYEKNLASARKVYVSQTPVWDEYARQHPGRVFTGLEGDIAARSQWCRAVLDGGKGAEALQFNTPLEALLIAAAPR